MNRKVCFVLISASSHGRSYSDGKTMAHTVVTNTATPPSIKMRILDHTGHDAQIVSLGDDLTLKIELKDQGKGSAFAMFARNLYARSSNGESLFLIDKSGCPTDASVFPALQLDSADNRSLYSKFKAFRFPSTGVVNFEVQIRFCQEYCEPVKCTSLVNGAINGNHVKSFGRRKRRQVDDKFSNNTFTEVFASGVNKDRPVHSDQYNWIQVSTHFGSPNVNNSASLATTAATDSLLEANHLPLLQSDTNQPIMELGDDSADLKLDSNSANVADLESRSTRAVSRGFAYPSSNYRYYGNRDLIPLDADERNGSSHHQQHEFNNNNNNDDKDDQLGQQRRQQLKPSSIQEPLSTADGSAINIVANNHLKQIDIGKQEPPPPGHRQSNINENLLSLNLKNDTSETIMSALHGHSVDDTDRDLSTGQWPPSSSPTTTTIHPDPWPMDSEQNQNYAKAPESGSNPDPTNASPTNNVPVPSLFQHISQSTMKTEDDDDDDAGQESVVGKNSNDNLGNGLNLKFRVLNDASYPPSSRPLPPPLTAFVRTKEFQKDSTRNGLLPLPVPVASEVPLSLAIMVDDSNGDNGPRMDRTPQDPSMNEDDQDETRASKEGE